MIRAEIQSVPGADYFILNGIKRPRSYEAIGVKLLAEKQGVRIIPVQREGISLQDTILFDQYSVDGEIPESQEDCISLLNQVVFKKGGGNGVGVVHISIVPIGGCVIFKRGTTTPNDLEPGDYVIRIVENQKIEGMYLGGDEQLLESYDYDTSVEF